MAKIVWTPANSEMGLGTVVMERPLKPLTMEEYRARLLQQYARNLIPWKPGGSHAETGGQIICACFVKIMVYMYILVSPSGFEPETY